jgi:hypothetical protein
MFEVHDRIYVVALDKGNKINLEDGEARSSYSLLTSSAPQLAVPVSFMALYDDTIMTTYTVSQYLNNSGRGNADNPQTLGQRQQAGAGPGRLFPTKAIRIVSLAPDLYNSDYDHSDERAAALPRPLSQQAEAARSQNALLQYLALLEEEPSDGDEEVVHHEDGEWVDVDDDID